MRYVVMLGLSLLTVGCSEDRVSPIPPAQTVTKTPSTGFVPAPPPLTPIVPPASTSHPGYSGIPEYAIKPEEVEKEHPLDADVHKAARCFWYCIVANTGDGKSAGTCWQNRCVKMAPFGAMAIDNCMKECRTPECAVECVALSPEDAKADKACGKSDSCRLRYFSK